MKCINCGCELPEDARFCFGCGAKQPEIEQEEVVKEETKEEDAAQEEPAQEEPVQEETHQEEMPHKFCPYCGAKNDEDAVFCCSCGNNMDMNTTSIVAPALDNPYVSKKKSHKKLVVGVAAVVVAAGAIGVGGALLGGKHQYVAYLKDGDINQTDLEHYKKEPVEYSGDYGDNEAENHHYANVKFSKDKKYIFYPTEVTYEDSYSGAEFRLNMQKVGTEEDPIKIDSSVRRYTVLKNNKVIYIKSGNDTLYINDKKDNKEKLASDVEAYYIDDAEKNIVWIESEDGLYSLYQQDLDLKKDKKTLAKDVHSYSISENLKQIAVREEDTLYLIKNFGDKEKVSSNVSHIIANSEESGSICYCKLPEKMVMGSDIVEDDCADSDAGITEPDYNSFITEKVEKNEYTGKYERVEGLDEEAYDLAWEAYDAKESRDQLREDLSELEIGTYVSELYCFKDGKEELLDKNFSEELYDYGENATGKGVFAFNRYNMEEVPKIKMSEIDDSSELSSMYYDMLRETRETCVYIGGKVISLEEDFDYAVALAPDENVGYGMKLEDTEDSEGTFTLMSFKMEGKGSCTTVAEAVNSIQMMEDGKVYYLSEASEGSGELYCNGEHIDSDVLTGSLKAVKGDIVYAVDYDSDKKRASLKLYNGKEDVKVADDVHAYRAFDEESIVVLTDYRLDRQEGDLKYYNGKEKLAEIDDEVTSIFGGTVFY